MSQQPEFKGWLGLDKDSAKGNMKWQSYEPKPWEETDVEIKITHCGYVYPPDNMQVLIVVQYLRI